MQIAKNFVFGNNVLRSDWNNTPLEDQINEYLENHPGFSVAAMSLLSGAGYREALIVFNVREERTEKDNRRQGKSDFTSSSTKDYKSQTKVVTTTRNPDVVNNNG